MSTQICNPCAEGKVCVEGLDNYSLQDDVYYFVTSCGPNVYCGGASTIYLVCCDGTTMQQTIPQGSTVAQRNALIADLVSRCARLTSFCDPGGGGGGDRPPGTNVPNDGTDPNNPVPYYWNNPTRATVRCSDGNPFTFKVPAGVFLARTQAEADAAALAWARQMAAANKICLTAPLRVCCNNVPYSSTVVASGGIGVLDGNGGFGPSVFTWNIIGTLPPGLTAVPYGHNGLRISGIPTTNGNYTFTIRAVDTHGAYMDKPTSIRIWGITDTSLPDATEGDPYSHQLTTTGGTAPYTYTLVSGGFPLGISLSSTGLIDGLAGESGAFPSIIRVRDATGATCSKELTLTSNAVTDCSSVAGDSTQTWSFSELPNGDYEIVSAMRLVYDTDYWGKNFSFDGTEGGALLLQTLSDDTVSKNHCVYIQLEVDTVNNGTGEITFVGTHNWTANCFVSQFSELMHKTGPNSGIKQNVQSNTASSIFVTDASTFSAGDEVMLIEYTSPGYADSLIESLPATETYKIETGVWLVLGQEDIEWTYNIECRWGQFESTYRTGVADVVGFTPYGETDAGTYARYLKLDCTAASSGNLTIDTILVRSWTGALSGVHEYDHAGTLLTKIQQNITDIVPVPGSVSGDLAAWNAPGLPTIPTSGSVWGWYDDISGYSALPVWAWTTPDDANGTAALSGSGSGTVNDFGTIYVWTTTLSGTAAFTVPFDPQLGALAQLAVEITGTARSVGLYLNWPPTWDVNHWHYPARYLLSYNTEVFGLVIGNTYKVTVELIDDDTLLVIDTDEQTFVAVATSHVLTGTIAASATDITPGQILTLDTPVIVDVTP